LPATDLDILIDAAIAAGQEAERNPNAHTTTCEKHDGGGPATAADPTVDPGLHSKSYAARPN